MLLTCHFYARSLSSEQEIQVILPDKLRKNTGEKAPVLYLLHGMLGDSTDWTRYTSLERYAKQYNVAIVMPSAGNSFYHNQSGGQFYYDYIANELPEFVTSILPISTNREENFIAGLSMGGFGAFYIGLQNYNQFSHVASFSGPLDLYEGMQEKRYQAHNGGDSGIFEVLEPLNKNSDLFSLIDSIQFEKLPNLFISCGKQDFVYEDFDKMKSFLNSHKIKFFAQDGDGKHEWEYWDKQISDLLAWLPVEKREEN
ncbi:alpha/beta hydrolase [Scatolibacter rhodanostii]|uniref:alpha/beta hydrolase n=1 Tax=Scatolibacter rhodanostii TaxID=2014781 RepID=UPI0013563986|nr:alpha/beta hydrolase family protein [Scatolibacter rhodanostii]